MFHLRPDPGYVARSVNTGKCHCLDSPGRCAQIGKAERVGGSADLVGDIADGFQRGSRITAVLHSLQLALNLGQARLGLIPELRHQALQPVATRAGHAPGQFDQFLPEDGLNTTVSCPPLAAIRARERMLFTDDSDNIPDVCGVPA